MKNVATLIFTLNDFYAQTPLAFKWHRSRFAFSQRAKYSCEHTNYEGYNKATQLQTGALIPRATSFKIPLL